MKLRNFLHFRSNGAAPRESSFDLAPGVHELRL